MPDLFKFILKYKSNLSAPEADPWGAEPGQDRPHILLFPVLKFFETVVDIDQDIHVGGLSTKIIGRTVARHELLQQVTIEMRETGYIISGKAEVHIVLLLFPQNAFLQLQALADFGRAMRYDIQLDAYTVALTLALDHRLRLLLVDPAVYLSALQAVQLIIAQTAYRYSLQRNRSQIQPDGKFRAQDLR